MSILSCFHICCGNIFSFTAEVKLCVVSPLIMSAQWAQASDVGLAEQQSRFHHSSMYVHSLPRDQLTYKSSYVFTGVLNSVTAMTSSHWYVSTYCLRQPSKPVIRYCSAVAFTTTHSRHGNSALPGPLSSVSPLCSFPESSLCRRLCWPSTPVIRYCPPRKPAT